jgi:hypothetical protein
MMSEAIEQGHHEPKQPCAQDELRRSHARSFGAWSGERQENIFHGFSTGRGAEIRLCSACNCRAAFSGVRDKPNKTRGFMVGAQGIEPWTSPV